jgi:hypothetical protein
VVLKKLQHVQYYLILGRRHKSASSKDLIFEQSKISLAGIPTTLIMPYELIKISQYGFVVGSFQFGINSAVYLKPQIEVHLIFTWL